MARTAVTRGRCYICKKEFGKTAMKNHLLKCNNLGSGNTKYFMIKVEGYYDKNYWLYVQVKQGATLGDLDSFLRDIWLECCGHLSAFEIDGTSYNKIMDGGELDLFGDDEGDMDKTKLKDVLAVGTVFKHEYDFGSTTTLKLTVIDEYSGISTKDKVTLLARNIMEQHKCEKCGEKAAYIAVDEDEKVWCLSPNLFTY